MILKKDKTVKVSVATDIICDYCGKRSTNYEQYSGNDDYGTLSWNPGFTSEYYGSYIVVDLCAECTLHFIEECRDRGNVITDRLTEKPFVF